jgi:excisionase family DNA binding protein
MPKQVMSPMQNAEPKLMKFNTACERLAVSRRTLATLVSKGAIRCVKIGALNHVEEAELQRFIEANRVSN